MPINIHIDGDPESIRSAARWLRSSLSAGVGDATTQVYRARGDSEAAWEGEASNAFRAKMTSGGAKADQLSADADLAGQSFEVYADDLQTARAGMDRARQIALDGGLEVTDTEIRDPGAGPTLLAGADGTVSPQVAQEYQAAQQAHQQKVNAYNAAAGEAARAQGVLEGGQSAARRVWNDFWGKRYFNAADFVNGTTGALAGKHYSVLGKHADWLMDDSKRLQQHYLKTGDAATRAQLNKLSYQKFIAGQELRSRALSGARRFGSKIPIIGLGITAAGIGYDIHTGKPPGKAIISGVGGALAAAGVAAAVGGPIGVGVGAGIVAGVVVGVGLEYAYDALPDNVTNAIEDGIEDVGSAVADGAKKVWDSIF